MFLGQVGSQLHVEIWARAQGNIHKEALQTQKYMNMMACHICNTNGAYCQQLSVLAPIWQRTVTGSKPARPQHDRPFTMLQFSNLNCGQSLHQSPEWCIWKQPIIDVDYDAGALSAWSDSNRSSFMIFTMVWAGYSPSILMAGLFALVPTNTMVGKPSICKIVACP